MAVKTLSVPLSRPLTVGGKQLDSLTMREPTLAAEEDGLALAVDLGRGNVPLTAEMCMFALLCGVNYDAMREMRSSDYARLRAAYEKLSRPTPEVPENKDAGVPRDGTPATNSGSSDAASSD